MNRALPHPSRSIAVQLLQLPSELRRQLWTAATEQAQTKPEIYDVVCVGGGPAGLSLLAALRSHSSTKDLKIALIDSQPISRTSPPTDAWTYSNRCSSLTNSSIRFLKQIGAWQHIDRSRIQDYHGMQVWDGISGTKISFDPKDKPSGILQSVLRAIPGSHNRPSDTSAGNTIATMCENNNLTSALVAHLKELAGVDMIDGTKVSSIDLGPAAVDDRSLDLSEWPIVRLPSGRSLAARLLIGADGANSPVRQFANIPAHGWDYNAHGVVATLNLDQEFSAGSLRTAYQRFLPTGPIALLPLPGKKASLVWSTTPQIAANLRSLSAEDFVAMVNAAYRLLATDIAYIQSEPSGQVDEFAWREGQTDTVALGLPRDIPRVVDVQAGSIAAFPLRMRHADTYTGHRVALIGDAAHTIHPLAGQGLNLGLADAESLAGRIADGIETGMDIGSSWCLDSYNGDRWAANNAVMGVCDKLNKLYSTDSAPVVAIRSLGLGIVDRLGPLKGMIMGAAAGGAP